MTRLVRVTFFSLSSLALLAGAFLGCVGGDAGKGPAASTPEPRSPKEPADSRPAGTAGTADIAGTAAGDHVELAQVRGVRFVVAPAPQAEGSWYAAEAVGDESASALLSVPVQGVLAAILVPPGHLVPAGKPLLTVQSPELAQLKGAWLGAKAKRARAEAELAREQRLSQRDLEIAQMEAATHQAEEEAARLALEARGLRHPEQVGAIYTLRAPRAGSVSTYKVQLGQGIEAGQELGAFQAGAAALAKLDLPLPGPEVWKPGMLTEARDSAGHRWRARVEGMPAALTEDTRRLSYRLRLEGAPLPIPGAPLEVRVPFAKAIILPQAALQQIEGTWGVFVKEGEEATFRPVRRGLELGSDVMVPAGLRAGETVAVEGAYLLKSLLLKRKNGGEDHDH
jgi:cobalt-zinc-cadmium efflux system membrane fusion protein